MWSLKELQPVKQLHQSGLECRCLVSKAAHKCLCKATYIRVLWIPTGLRGSQRSQNAHLPKWDCPSKNDSVSRTSSPKWHVYDEVTKLSTGRIKYDGSIGWWITTKSVCGGGQSGWMVHQNIRFQDLRRKSEWHSGRDPGRREAKWCVHWLKHSKTRLCVS